MKRFISIWWIRYSLYILAVLPLFILRDFSLDNELRYLSIADEAIRNGSVLTFYNHGIIYADKPPLYLWIVMLGKMLFGFHSMVFLGIFSFIPALVIVYTMDQWVKTRLSDKQRLMAELILLTNAYFMGTAIVLRMDMLMTMFIVLALAVFYKMYNGQGKPIYSLLFPLCVFMALFTKGPIGLIVPLVSTSVFLFIKGKIKTMGRYWGLTSWLIIIFLCSVWFTGVYIEGGRAYISDLLLNQTIHRAVHAFHHSEPFYYYFLVIWYALIPWSLFLIAIVIAGMRQKLISNDLELFFLVTFLSTFICLSLFSSKLAVYLLPAFPFLVCLSVMWLQRLEHQRWFLLLIAIPAVLFCLAMPVIIILHYFNLRAGLFSVLAAMVISVTGIFTLILLKKNRLNNGILTMGAGLMIGIFVISFATPAYNPIIGLRQLTQQARQLSMQNGGAHYYYCHLSRADNLDVYLGVKPEKLMIKDLFKKNLPMRKPAILFLSSEFIQKNDSLQQFLKGKEKHVSGDYFFIEIK